MNDAAGFSVGDTERPTLYIKASNLPDVAAEMRDIIAKHHPHVFDRGGMPSQLVWPAEGGPPRIVKMGVDHIVNVLHAVAQPLAFRKEEWVPVTLPDRVARLYLALPRHGIRPLAGVTTAPLLQPNGDILIHSGYEPKRMLWCEPPPEITVPDKPTRYQADNALRTLRRQFRTFPFADSPLIEEGDLQVVDTREAPRMAESSMLAVLIGAVCRPSLDFCPGALLTAPEISGAGTGKGLAIRGANQIAFGWQPAAFTGGHDNDEREKRIAGALIEGQPAIFLDNVNSKALSSDTLASALTERPAAIRNFGTLSMLRLHVATFIAITGNGLSASEDLLRRFVLIELDPRCENPEARPFPGGFLDDVTANRAALLSAALTIWRWGRQNVRTITKGLPLGGFETWGRWVRDPLVALGCQDPVKRLQAKKATDPRRVRTTAILSVWHGIHGDEWTTPSGLHENVLAEIGRGRPVTRQAIGWALQKMAGTRVGGFVLEYQEPDNSRKQAGQYRVCKLGADDTDDADVLHPLREGVSEKNNINGLCGENHPRHPRHPRSEELSGVDL